MILRMRDVSAMTFEVFERIQSGADVSGSSQVVAVQMQRMGQVELMTHASQRRDDMAGSQRTVAFD